MVEGVRRGSSAALAALYRRYWPLAWQWAYAMTGSRARADDLAQDAFMRALDALAGFDVERPFGPWLKRILVNLGIDEMRRLHRADAAVLDSWMRECRPADALEPGASDDLVDAVRTLPPPRRLVVVLHYWLDLSIDEIGALLELPRGTVCSRLSRARADLRLALEDEHVRNA